MKRPVLSVAVAIVIGAASLAAAPPATASVGGVVAINELMPAPTTDQAEFLELRNVTGAPVDVGGWCFVEGIDGCLPGGTTIAANGFLLMVQDVAIARATWGIPAATPLYLYTGGQKSGGETIRLVDAGAAVADEVTYGSIAPWPSSPSTGAASMERINPTTGSSTAANWAASDPSPTPLAENTAYDVTGGPSFEVVDLTATPFRPNPGQSIVVSTELSEAATVSLTYLVDFGAPVTVPMSLASGTTYTATIPAQGPGDLVRFRVDADTGTEQASKPIAGDSFTYEGVVVRDPADAASVPVIEWFMADAVYNDLLANHRYDDVTGHAVMTYDGVVFDNTEMRVRGDTTRGEPKVSWKVELASGHLFDMGGLLRNPVDEFNLQRDTWPLAKEGWNIVEGAGQPKNDYVFVRQQRNGDFYGVGAVMEPQDGRWRDRNGYGDDSFYKVGDSKLKPYSSEAAARADLGLEKKEGDEGDFTDIYELSQGINRPVGPSELRYIYDSFDVPALVNYLAVISLLRHVDSDNKNYSITRDSVSGRWELLHWDLDYIFRPDEPADPRSQFPMAKYLNNRVNESFFAYPELEALLYRRIRTLRDELLATTSNEDEYAATINALLAEYVMEEAIWNPSGSPSGHISSNYQRVQFQRTTIDGATAPSGPVPTSQAAHPTILINEIQHSPVPGSDAEFVELYNPNPTPIDLSGWQLADGVDLSFRGGTVIPAQGYLVLVSDSPTFLATYGSGTYVGGYFSGKLSGSGEQVRLLDASGTQADAVTFSPNAPWPASGDGPSIERISPTGGSNDPANWGRSQGNGSPGRANTATAAPPRIRPSGVIGLEGDTGSSVYQLPVHLSAPSSVPVSIDWATVDTNANPAVAQAGSDFVSASGTVTFAPGETTKLIPITILGDTVKEPPLLWGEWGIVSFSNPTNATLDVTTFFGVGLFVIVDDD